MHAHSSAALCQSTCKCFVAVGQVTCTHVGIQSIKSFNFFHFILPNKQWGAGVVICLERDAGLHMAQLMPLPLTVSLLQ